MRSGRMAVLLPQPRIQLLPGSVEVPPGPQHAAGLLQRLFCAGSDRRLHERLAGLGTAVQRARQSRQQRPQELREALCRLLILQEPAGACLLRMMPREGIFAGMLVRSLW